MRLLKNEFSKLRESLLFEKQDNTNINVPKKVYLSDADFKSIDELRFVTEEGKIEDFKSMEGMTKGGLEKKLKSSYIFTEIDKNKKQVVEKNTSSFVMSFLKYFNSYQADYLNRTADEFDMSRYPYGDMARDEIFSKKNLRDLIALEKNHYLNLLREDGINQLMFYLEGTSMICNNLNILGPIALMMYSIERPTVH